MRKLNKTSRSLIYIISSCLFLYNALFAFSQHISYYLEIDEQNWDSYHVRILIEDLNQNHIVLAMPAWRPGAYMRGDFGQYVKNFKAYGETSQQLPTIRLDQNRWSVEVRKSTFIRVEYDVDHSVPRFMGRCLDSTFAMIDGAMNFMYWQNNKNLPLNVSFRVPHGWKLVTGLPEGQVSFEYRVQNYDQLIDCPIFMSKFQEYYFTLQDHQFYVIINGNPRININKFLLTIKKIAFYQINLLEEIPFDKYFFLFNITPNGLNSGGLEHRNSTYIKLSPQILRPNLSKVANIVAHEFFHLWNVKRLHPHIWDSYDYAHESRTKYLWFCEGITSYYADLTLIRANIISEKDFLERQAKLIEELQQNPERHNISLEEASLQTWDKSIYQNELLYYGKGQLIGNLLDLSIRHVTNNERSLDDLIRFMNWWFARYNQGYHDGDILRAINAITYHDFSVFFDKYIRGTVELPYQEIFDYAGITVDIKSDTLPDLGLLKISGRKNKVVVLAEAGPLAKAGLKQGDYLYSINGRTVHDISDIPPILETLKPGTEIIVTAERNGIRLNLHANIGEKEKITCQLKFSPQPDELQSRIRQSWLEGRKIYEPIHKKH